MKILTPILAAIPLAAVLIGEDERILAANALAHDHLGASLEGRHFLTVLRQPALLAAIESTLQDRESRKTSYQTLEGGQDNTYSVHVAYVETPEVRGALVCFDDITDVEQAGQMRRDFVANVSHELRTPLTALIGFIETLQGPARHDQAAIDRFLRIMQSEAARMERLVRDLLSLSRVESEERVRPKEPVDLGQIIQSVLLTLRPLARDRGTDLTFTRIEDMIVPGDSDQLQQVFTNLIENAIKYSGEANHVSVTLETVERDAMLRSPAVTASVKDCGPGIDPLHIPRLTERFYRVDTHRSREMGGTGLGLAIVKHIVNRHRGRLRIASVPGEGSTFSVTLPLWRKHESEI